MVASAKLWVLAYTGCQICTKIAGEGKSSKLYTVGILFACSVTARPDLKVIFRANLRPLLNCIPNKQVYSLS